MKDFLDDLDDRLRVIAEEHASADAPAPARRRAYRRRPALLAGLTGVLATAGAVFAMNGVSMADLPILSTKSVDASGIATAAEPARAAGVDFSEAHFFPTANGPGYVVQTPNEDVLCLTIPTRDGEYRASCAGRDQVERQGLRLENTANVGVADRSEIAFVLPSGAQDVRVTGSGARDGNVQIVSGVVSAAIRSAVEVRWIEDETPRSATFDGPFEEGATVKVTCPDGREIVGPIEVLQPPPLAQIDQDALERACR